MNILPKELSPERCHQLREQGILRLLVHLLHDHTFEHEDKPEADFNIEMFLMDFNRKAELRARLSQQLQTIFEHTAKNEDELKVHGWLETLRSYIDRLYNFMVGWKAMTEDSSKLNECTDQLTELAGQVKEVIEVLKTLTVGDTAYDTCPSFEQFGGVFVIVDYLRAQTRFNAQCHQFGLDQIDTSQFLGLANDSKLVLRDAVAILCNLVTPIDSRKDIKLFLGNCRSLHEIMVGIAEDAYDDGDLQFVHIYCHLLYNLYQIFIPTDVLPSTSHLKDWGVIKCLAKFCMKIKDPKTLFDVLMGLQAPLIFDRRNALEFVSIDDAVDILIDVLVPSDEKDEDSQNANWYEGQRCFSICLLAHISRYLMPQDQMSGRLLAIYESRDIAVILVRYLERIPLINDFPNAAVAVLPLLRFIILRSEDQRRKFTEIVNGKEVVKGFESSDDGFVARVSKQIGEMFE